jgi:2-polyprenyl-3-methyl-5-hydroxy-6-metoxy-1,4-benzoquinol methylase
VVCGTGDYKNATCPAKFLLISNRNRGIHGLCWGNLASIGASRGRYNNVDLFRVTIQILEVAMFKDVTLNRFGYYTLNRFPTEEEREQYYADQYYQLGKGGYETSYTEAEIAYINAQLEQTYAMMAPFLSGGGILDVGCGEGYALAFFKRKGFAVLGLDYSTAGVYRHNPDVAENLIVGDLYDNMIQLIDKDAKFDAVYMGNVLEHVTSPPALLALAARLLDRGSIALICVPNDFNALQRYYFDNKIITAAHWIAPLDHLHYFNRDGLINVCEAAGLTCVDIIGDGLVELFALNPMTNYYENKGAGKDCHKAAVLQENLFNDISMEKTLTLYRALGDMGLGRQIVGVFLKQL